MQIAHQKDLPLPPGIGITAPAIGSPMPEPMMVPETAPDVTVDEEEPLIRRRHDAGIPMNDPSSVF